MPEDSVIPNDAHDRRNGWRTQPLYTIREAAHLAHVAPITVRRWLHGYMPDPRQPWRKSPPVFGETDAEGPFVSFLQLVEIVMASDFRKVGHVKLDVVRLAHKNAREQWGIEYPFAHLELESLGGHIIRWLREAAPSAQTVDVPEQWTLPNLVADRMHDLVYVSSLAARWYPVGKGVPIVIDPRFSAGLPTIAGRGVTVSTIYKRWKADQTIKFIADDLQIETAVIERALQYADKIAA